MRRLLTALVLATLAAACTSERGDMDDKLAALAQRPTLEEVRVSYEKMQDQLRDRLSAEVGLLEWVDDQNLSGAGCADFPGAGGQSLTLDSWTSRGNLPDTQWDRAVAIVAEMTGNYGFGPPKTVVDRPSDHEITATDQYGGAYQFGTARNTVLMVSTGCHLPADDHPRTASGTGTG
ncbi:MAG: LppA family lipoprotein [Pseudonocardiaceae bacterium]